MRVAASRPGAARERHGCDGTVSNGTRGNVTGANGTVPNGTGANGTVTSGTVRSSTVRSSTVRSSTVSAGGPGGVTRSSGAEWRTLRPLVLTGFGLGAFLDGIVLHQVLQWHHLVDRRRSADDLAGLEANTLADGLFHLVSWLLVLVGVLWIARSRADLRAVPWRGLVGPLLVGWGLFNITDQLLFHLLLAAHHIRPGEHEQLYDWGYTALGALLVLVGVRLAQDRTSARR